MQSHLKSWSGSLFNNRLNTHVTFNLALDFVEPLTFQWVLHLDKFLCYLWNVWFLALVMYLFECFSTVLRLFLFLVFYEYAHASENAHSPEWYIVIDEIKSTFLPTSREGNVFTGICHSVHNRPHGNSVTAHPCYSTVSMCCTIKDRVTVVKVM